MRSTTTASAAAASTADAVASASEGEDPDARVARALAHASRGAPASARALGHPLGRTSPSSAVRSFCCRSPTDGSTSRRRAEGDHQRTACPPARPAVRPGAMRSFGFAFRGVRAPCRFRTGRRFRRWGARAACRGRQRGGSRDRGRRPTNPRAARRRRRDDEEVAGTRRRHVEDAIRLLSCRARAPPLRAWRDRSAAQPAMRIAQRWRSASTQRCRSRGVSLAVMSARITTGNSSPLARWTVMMRTPSVPSSTIGASPTSPLSASSLSRSTNDAERADAAALRAAREVEQAGDVRERLLARRPDREARRGRASRRAGGRSCRRSGRRLRSRWRSRSTASASPTSRTASPASAGIGRSGCSAPMASWKASERRVGQGEERPAERGEHRQLVLRPLDRRERVADRLDLLAAVEASCRRPADAGSARLERADVASRRCPRGTSGSAGRAGRRAAAPMGHRRRGRSRSVTRPAARADQPVDERTPTASGSDSSILHLTTRAEVAVGPRHRQHDDRAAARGGARGTARAARSVAWLGDDAVHRAARRRRSRRSGSRARCGSSSVRWTSAAPAPRRAGASTAS